MNLDAAAVIGLLTLVVGVPLNVLVVLTLLRKSRDRPDLKVLAERFVVALVILVLVAVFGLIFVNNDTVPPILGLPATKLITRITVLILAVVPAAIWLRLYRTLR